MDLRIFWLILALHLAFQKVSNAFVSPILQTSPYFESSAVDIKQDVNTIFNSMNPITKTITFKKAYSQIPQLAYSLKNYRANDRLGTQSFSLVRTALTTSGFTIFTRLQGATNLRIMSMFYFVVDKSYPDHINAFHEVDANYSDGPLVNITTSRVGIRSYRNVVSYSTLAGSIGSSHLTFGSDLSQNHILPFMTGLFLAGNLAAPTAPIQLTCQTQILSPTQFEITITIHPEILITFLQFSIVVVDKIDVQKSGLLQVNIFATNFPADLDQYVSVPQEFIGNGLFGMQDFKTSWSGCGFEFNFQFDLQNNRIIFNQSVPYSLSTGTCGFQSFNGIVFYLKGWYCPNEFPYLNTTERICQQLICGDRRWMTGYEACEDGNTINNDGCDQFCTVETDFTCLVTDQLPNGLSLCKYTLNVTFSLKQIIKNDTTSSLNFIFVISPGNLATLNQSTVQSMLTSLQITSPNDPSTVLILQSDIIIKFNPNVSPNQVELIVSYNNQSLNGSLLNFTINPSNTLNPSIYHLPSNDYSIKIQFQQNVVNLSSIANHQSESDYFVQILSQIIGSSCLILLIFGFFIPGGRLIIVEGLAVVQLSFFSILQLQKIPSSFKGLKFLILSSGYGNINKLVTNPNPNQNVYSEMGLSKQIYQNFTLGIVLVGLPFVFGGIGMILTKILMLKQQKYEIKEQDPLESTQRYTLQKKMQKQSVSFQKQTSLSFTYLFFKRILHESTLYSLLASGYSIFISIFYSLGNYQLLNIVLIASMAFIWLLYSIILVKGHQNTINLNKIHSSDKVNSSELKNGLFLTEFGQFREVHQQFSGIEKYKKQNLQKMYIIFLAERIIVSALIVFISKKFTYNPILIAVIFIIILAVLNVSYGFYKKQLPEKDKKPVFSYLNKNYTLRQSINFITVIIVESLFLVFQILGLTEDEDTILKTNIITTKVIPFSILALLMTNILANMIFLVWQIKQSEMISKAKVIITILFGIQFANKNCDAKNLHIECPRDDSSRQQRVDLQKVQKLEKQKDSQDKQIEQQLNNYVQQLTNFNKPRTPIHMMIERQTSKRNINLKLDFQKDFQYTDKKVGMSKINPKLTQDEHWNLMIQPI